MAWSDCVGPGWKEIVDTLVTLCEKECVSILQVKEKFGGLRFYTAAAPEYVDNIIRWGEWKAERTCEVCGERGELRDDLSWMLTLCDKHYEERKNGGNS